MKNLILTCVGMLLICITNINAQEVHRVDEIEIVNAQTNNVTVQIKTAEAGATVLSRLNQTNANAKDGFNAQLNADNTLLTLNFSKQFTENELNILLEYSGIKLKETDLNQLINLLN